MRFALFLLALFLGTSIPPILAVIKGNKFSIQMAPWLVYGEGYFKEQNFAFGSSLIHPRLALTIAPIAKSFSNITLRAGVAKLTRTMGQRRDVDTAQYKEFVGILRVKMAFQLGPNVQLASLAIVRHELHHWNLYLAAGWGQVNWYNTRPNELHVIPTYPSYKGLSEEDSQKKILLTGFVGHANVLGWDDMGGPVWDPWTGEIVGLIFDWEFIEKKNVHTAISVGYYREWIDEVVMHEVHGGMLPSNTTKPN